MDGEHVLPKFQGHGNRLRGPLPLYAQELPAPLRQVGKLLVEIPQQGLLCLPLHGVVKGGVQPVAEEGPAGKGQGLRHLRLVVLAVPQVDSPAAAGVLDQLCQLGGAGGVRVLRVVVQDLLGEVFPAPLDMVFHVLFRELAVSQSLLEVRAAEKGPDLRPGLFPILRLPGLLQSTRLLAKDLKFLVQRSDVQLSLGDVGDLLQHPGPKVPIEQLGPAHEGGFQLQLLPGHLIELFRQLLPPEEVVDEPHPRRVALRRRGVFVLEVPDHIAVQDVPRFF